MFSPHHLLRVISSWLMSMCNSFSITTNDQKYMKILAVKIGNCQTFSVPSTWLAKVSNNYLRKYNKKILFLSLFNFPKILTGGWLTCPFSQISKSLPFGKKVTHTSNKIQKVNDLGVFFSAESLVNLTCIFFYISKQVLKRVQEFYAGNCSGS